MEIEGKIVKLGLKRVQAEMWLITATVQWAETSSLPEGVRTRERTVRWDHCTVQGEAGSLRLEVAHEDRDYVRGKSSIRGEVYTQGRPSQSEALRLLLDLADGGEVSLDLVERKREPELPLDSRSEAH